MKSKTCPNCGKTSYSASDKPWVCPYCDKDISEVKVNGDDFNENKSR